MTINQKAVKIAKEFYKITQRRTTAFNATIGQAKHLLNAGFTEEEIIQGIEYFVKYPPKNGFNSLGWLSYGLEDALKKIKAKQVKEEMEKVIYENIDLVTKPLVQNAQTSQERVNKDFDFNMFGE